jgi:hypothetical protein
VIVALGSASASIGLEVYVPRHFVPEQALERLPVSDGGTILLGNSLLAAGGDQAVFQARGENAPWAPVGNMAIGATLPAEHVMAFRRALDRMRPRLLVYGWSASQLLPADYRVADVTGNRAILFTWSRATDVSRVTPGFPLARWADALTFLAARALPVVAYAPVVQGRVELWRRGLAASGTSPSNRFGRTADFQTLASDSWQQVSSQAVAIEHGEAPHPDRWVRELRDEAHARGVPIVWVAMPVAPGKPLETALAPGTRLLVESVKRELVGAGDYWLDATVLPGIGAAQFSDGLHLTPDGARVFSEWLCDRLDSIPGPQVPPGGPR